MRRYCIADNNPSTLEPDRLVSFAFDFLGFIFGWLYFL